MDDRQQAAPDSIPRPGEEPIGWSELLAAYRREPKGYWAGLLISRLGPWLTAARRQLHAAPPYLDADDVAQQLLVEVLSIARRWDPSCEDRWIPRRLVERAGRKLLKTLLAERLDQAVELSDEVEAPGSAEPVLVVDTPLGKASIADLRLIFRVNVLGEPMEVLAEEAGVSVKRLRRRLKAARERARTKAAVAAR